jgi:hypothetical protein
MNLRRTADSLKALPLFGVLLLCGVDLETPQPPGFELAARNAAMVACEQDAGCMANELWSSNVQR